MTQIYPDFHLTGLPLFELSSKADEALRMALDEINARYARINLYRVSKASVTRVGGIAGYIYLAVTLQSNHFIQRSVSSSSSRPATSLAMFSNTNNAELRLK